MISVVMFMRKSYAFCQEHEQEIRAHMEGLGRTDG